MGTSFTESNLTSETNYVYAVRTIANNGQVSAFSNELTVMTEPTPEPEEGE